MKVELLSNIWAMEPAYLQSLASVDPEKRVIELSAAMTRQPAEQPRKLAVVPIHGGIGLSRGWFAQTSTRETVSAIHAAVASENVGAILLHIDSPGGTVYGLEELAHTIRSAKKRKPVYAHVDGMAASAAYWIASQATEISASPGSDVGSIGVYTMHIDKSAMFEDAGLKVTLISAGEFKIEGNTFEPITDSARSHIQGRIDAAYQKFVSEVAKGRNVEKQTVLDSFGKGRLVDSANARKYGMIDRVSGLAHTLGHINREMVRSQKIDSFIRKYK